jgi:hypothetical protein
VRLSWMEGDPLQSGEPVLNGDLVGELVLSGEDGEGGCGASLMLPGRSPKRIKCCFQEHMEEARYSGQ